MVKVLITSGWDPQGVEETKAAFPEVTFADGKTPETRLKEIEDTDIIFGPVDADSFKAAKNLKWVQSSSAGVEWLANVPDLVESDIPVANTSGSHAGTIAEHTMGMLIALARGFVPLTLAQQNKVWMRPLDFAPIGISGLTLGVIGFGNIGKAIAHLGNAFGMPIVAVDAHDVERPDYVLDFWNLDGLPELLKRADVVVTAVPFTPQTENMIGKEQFDQMKDGSYLIAISRGGIVNEEALAEALKSGKLAGAGLDVTVEEPMSPVNPLWDAPNLIITPHCSGTSSQTRAGAIGIFRRNLRFFLEGEPLTNVVNKKLGY